MARFADPTATDVYYLDDGCQCPGTPHETDWIRIRTEAGAGDLLTIANIDNPVGVLMALAVEWNLLKNDGEPAPLTPEYLNLLFGDGINAPRFRKWINENVRASSVKKASGARSSTGTQDSGRQNRQARRQRHSTKS